jgi:ribonuclease III
MPRRAAPSRGRRTLEQLQQLIEGLPDELARQSLSHASWTPERADSYERLAFLGDSVLALSVTTSLYPRFDAERYGAGRLTKIRAQTVSRRSCAEVARRMGLQERLAAAAPEETAAQLASTESVLAESMEAAIGACYLYHGFQATQEAVVEAFAPQVEQALHQHVDFKSSLQELLARRGEIVGYEVEAEHGPPHERTFDVVALVNGEVVGRGSGKSKKDAEQAAAKDVLSDMQD